MMETIRLEKIGLTPTKVYLVCDYNATDSVFSTEEAAQNRVEKLGKKIYNNSYSYYVCEMELDKVPG